MLVDCMLPCASCFNILVLALWRLQLRLHAAKQIWCAWTSCGCPEQAGIKFRPCWNSVAQAPAGRRRMWSACLPANCWR